MIKSDAQRERTVAQIEGFRRALAKVAEEKSAKRSATLRGSYEGMMRQLEDELREYDEVKSGALALPKVERIDQIAPFIVKLRIQAACEALQLEGSQISEVAADLGFCDQSSFTQLFQKHVGITPLKYQKRFRLRRE